MSDCARCSTPIVRRKNERRGRWLARIYCSRACSDAIKGETVSWSARLRFHASYKAYPATGCWLWTARTNEQRGGYGIITVGGKVKRAHRLAWELYRGTIPDGAIVRHKCDTPRCVNPDHLDLGSHRDNAHDAIGRGRHMHGARHVHTHLTDEDAIAIAGSQEPGVALAARYGVSRSTITNIRKGKVWGHATGACPMFKRRRDGQKDMGL